MPYRMLVSVAHAGTRHASVCLDVNYQPANPRFRQRIASRHLLVSVPREAPVAVFHRLILAAVAKELGVDTVIAVEAEKSEPLEWQDSLFTDTDLDATLSGRREGRGRTAMSPPNEVRGTNSLSRNPNRNPRPRV